MARYQVAGPLGYYGPTLDSSTPMLHPPGEIIEMADDGPVSLYWLPIDQAANAAIEREQQRQQQKRASWTNPSYWSWLGPALPHGVGATPDTVDGGPPAENWPPPEQQQQQQPTARRWPLGRSRLARHNR